MNALDIEELRAYADEAQAHFGDSNEFVVTLADGAVTMSFDLVSIIDAALEVMDTDRKCDDMLDLSRHLAYLAKIARRAVTDQQTATRGEP